MMTWGWQINPDGVTININWENFVVGTSLFIPAINLSALDKQMQIVAKDNNLKIKGFERVEAGKLGMRFWRLL